MASPPPLLPPPLPRIAHISTSFDIVVAPCCCYLLPLLQGVLSNASSPTAKAKLRLLFECAPIALVSHACCTVLWPLLHVVSSSVILKPLQLKQIVEGAGGSSCVAPCEAGQEVR